ncbi:hypothetical protein CLCR_10918 [Cladophialophora carrionii]|uniref:Uncharacterized protein n=1 Tax=Cladophialophora carrionii TaxID=86049 RepID=A0A1C1CW78_9EURO|nr:hypothetical protein CLCR_10918 [Cladophialophora carrionii]
MSPDKEITFILVNSGSKRRRSNASSINRHIARTTHARRRLQNPAKQLPIDNFDSTRLPRQPALAQESSLQRTEPPAADEGSDDGDSRRHTFWQTVLQAVHEDNDNERQEVEIKMEMEIEPSKAPSQRCRRQIIQALDIFRDTPKKSTFLRSRHGRYIDGLDLAILL